MAHPEITFATETIHRPDEPRHFMRLKPVNRRVTIRLGDLVLAESERALRLQEVGRDIYDPAYYVPREDVRLALRPVDGTTHCPLKGDASYFSAVDADGAVLGEKIAWSYQAPLPIAQAIAGLLSFYMTGLTSEERPIAT